MGTKINIGYGGGLQYFDQSMENVSFLRRFRYFFTAYSVNNVNKFARSAYHLFKCIELLNNDKRIAPDDIQIHLWGNIDERYTKLAEEMGIESYIQISGKISREENRAKLESMTMLLLPMEVGRNGSKSLFIPGKLYEYFRVKKPILGLGGDSDAKELALKSGLTTHFDFESYNAISKFILSLIENGIPPVVPDKEFIESKSFDVLTDDLAAVFNSVLS